MLFFFFFFKQKTAYDLMSGDWSSDVCSSDLFIFSNLVIGLLLLRTGLLLVSGKLLLQVDRETLLNKKEGS